MSHTLEKYTAWCADSSDTAVFRHGFTLDLPPAAAQSCIFADSYYALYINGDFIAYGPERFDPKYPQYDTIDIARYLKS
ncbi:MAG: hypothetical protein WCQ72_03360, partial [Eubacteriales bacterium]